jgi:hypothetical protein
MIVDCGGGTVDITVYEMITESGKLRELHQATGGPFGSTGTVRVLSAMIRTCKYFLRMCRGRKG